MKSQKKVSFTLEVTQEEFDTMYAALHRTAYPATTNSGAMHFDKAKVMILMDDMRRVDPET